MFGVQHNCSVAEISVHMSCRREFRRGPLIGGSRNTLAIDAEGQLWSWGWNDRGTLGHGHRALERKPRRVTSLKGVRIVQVRMDEAWSMLFSCYFATWATAGWLLV